MRLSKAQYGFVMSTLESVPKIFTATPAEQAEDARDNQLQPNASVPRLPSKDGKETESHNNGVIVDLLPELPSTAHATDGKEVQLWSTLEASFNVHSINLELFSAAVTDTKSLQNSSLARFSLDDTSLKMKMLSDGSLQAELMMKSFTIRDTHSSKASKFRDIIPPCDHGGHQLVISYTMTGGIEKTSFANVTLDTPSVIFSLDPVFRLADFAMSAFQPVNKPIDLDESVLGNEQNPEVGEIEAKEVVTVKENGIAFLVKIVSPTVRLLADPERSDSEAIILSLDLIQMSQQRILA